MPTVKRKPRQRRVSTHLKPDELMQLIQGEDCPIPWDCILSRERCADLWQRHKAAVMAAKAAVLVADYTYPPGTRPWAWWWFEHQLDWKLPELRHEKGRQLAWLREHGELADGEEEEAAFLERKREAERRALCSSTS